MLAGKQSWCVLEGYVRAKLVIKIFVEHHLNAVFFHHLHNMLQGRDITIIKGAVVYSDEHFLSQ